MLLWMQSFDQFGTDATQLTAGIFAEATGVSVANSAPTAPDGTTSFLKFASNGLIRRNFGAAKTTVGFACRWYVPNQPTVNDRVCPMVFRDASNVPHLTIVQQTTGALAVKRGLAGGTQLGVTADGVIPSASWTHIEAKVTISDTVGAVEIRVNGVTVLNLSGVDTANTALIETSQIAQGFPTGAPGSLPCSTDWVAWDTDTSQAYNAVADFVGDKQVFWQAPASDTIEADWTKSTGTVGYVLIDEAPPNTTDYVIATGVGDKSNFGVAGLPAGVVLITAVEVVAKSIKTDAGTGTMRLNVVAGGVEQNGAAKPQTTTYTYYSSGPVARNPQTLAPWTPSEVNAMQLGLERTA